MYISLVASKFKIFSSNTHQKRAISGVAKRGKDHVNWGWKAYTTPVRIFAASISLLLTDLASCLFSSGITYDDDSD